MNNKFIAVLLTLLMIMSLLPMTALGQGALIQENNLTFSDMPEGELGQVLQRAVDNGILGGMPDGTIAPEDHLTRAQLAAIVNRSFGSSSQEDISKFVDMKKDAWHYQDIAKAVMMGTLVGENGLMKPNRTITKQEAFAILARAFKLSGGTAANLAAYQDANLVSAWAKEVVATIVKGGYYVGSEGKLNAQMAITRAEFASVMDKLVSQYIKKAGTYTSEQVISKGNLMINAPGVILKDLIIAGDLILGDGVGNGDVTLDNVKVNGRLVVRGGGENSIRIIGGSNVGTVIVSRVDGVVRVAVSGDAAVSIVVIDDGSDDVTLEGTIGDVQILAEDITISAANAAITTATVSGAGSTLRVGQNSTINSVTVAPAAVNTNLDIRGTVTTANIQAPQTQSTISGTVTTLTAAATSTGSSVNVTANANVGTLNANAAIQVDNSGTIQNAEINSNGVVLDGNKADTVKVDTSVTEQPKNSSGDVVQPTPAPSGGGGGGGSSNVAVTGISVDQTTLTLTAGGATGTITATVLPVDATNKTVTWTSSNEAVATVAGGVVTPLTAGTTTITATTVDGGFTATTLVTVEAAEAIDVTLQDIFAETEMILISIFKTEGNDLDPTTREIPSLSASDFILIEDFGGANTQITGFTLEVDPLGGTWEYEIIPAVGDSFAPGNYRLGFSKAGYNPDHVDFVIAEEVDKTALTEVINAEYSDGASRTTYALTEADYTVVTWSAYTGAITAAIGVEEDEDATQVAVDEAADAIGTEKAALEFAGQIDLNTAKAAEALLTSFDYVDYSAVTTALALPETTNTEVVTKTTAINEAIAALVEAVAEIGGIGYATLADAVAAVSEQGTATITLLSDVTLSGRLDIKDNKIITINLNGETISRGSQPIRVAGGTLIVNGTGTIQETEDNGFAPILIKGSSVSEDTDYSNVTIGENVTLKGWAGIMIDQVAAGTPYAYGVNATFNGTIISPADDHTTAGHGIYVNGSIKHVDNCPSIIIGSTANIAATGTGIYAAGYADWTIADGAEISGGTTAIEIKAGTMAISGGTISTNAASTSHIANGNGGSTGGYALAVVDNAGYAGASVSITGGTFNGPVQLLDDDEITDNNESALIISGGTFSDLASVIKYSTENSDIAIKLMSDETLIENVLVSSGQSITLDLNGKTINSGLATAFHLRKGTLNVVDTAANKGGISVSGEAFRVNGKNNSNASEAVLDIEADVNVTSSSDCAVFIYGKATLNTAGKLTSNGIYATIQGNGISDCNGTVINITGGEVISTSAEYNTIYVPQDGDINISDGTITSSGTAIEAKGGRLTISGGTISTNAASTSHIANGNGGSTGGYALAVVDNAGYAGATVSITGGTFNGPVQLLDDDEITDNNESSLIISGGTFSSNLTDYLASGYVTTQNGETWVVTEGAADTTAPVITAADATVAIVDLAAWTETVSATDDVDGTITDNVVATYFESNGTTSITDLAEAKVYIGDATIYTTFVIKYNVSDAASNPAVEKVVTITVTQ